MDLLEKTLELAREAKPTAAEISAEVGLTWRWFQKVLNSEIPNPGVMHVQKLRELCERKLAEKKENAA